MSSDKRQSERAWLLRGVGLALLLVSCSASFAAEKSEQKEGSSFDVIHYDAQVEPDIAKKTITGEVLIQLAPRMDNLASITLDCGELVIDSVRENGAAQKFERQGQRLNVLLSRPANVHETRKIEIAYHGAPARGIRFFPELKQVYTVFSTSQWMVCVDAPDDRATLRLRLILPTSLTVVANGRLVTRRNLREGETVYEWMQETAIPTYIFGFAAGR